MSGPLPWLKGPSVKIRGSNADNLLNHTQFRTKRPVKPRSAPGKCGEESHREKHHRRSLAKVRNEFSDDKALEIPETLPMLPFRTIVVFPYMILPLYVGRESSIRAVEEALAKNRLIFLASQKRDHRRKPEREHDLPHRYDSR